MIGIVLYTFLFGFRVGGAAPKLFVMGGMIAAVVEHFNPDSLEQRFEKKPGNPLMSLSNDNWRNYRQEYEEISELLDEKELIRRFGASFEQAYTRTLVQLLSDMDEDTQS